MLLDVYALWRELWLILALLVRHGAHQGGDRRFATRLFVDSNFKAIRTGVTLAVGGEFGIALLTLLLQNKAIDPAHRAAAAGRRGARHGAGAVHPRQQPAHRAAVVRRARPAASTAIEREDAATLAVAKREHVILCGFGRVGQNVGRVLEAQGFEYIAIDLDPVRVRAARQIGQPVVYGDSADEQVLEEVGLANANAVVISFSDHAYSRSPSCAACAACAPMCRCWCARRTIRACSSSRPRAPPRSSPKPSRPASCWRRMC